ncbi:regulator of competence-specific genes [Vibrio gazogenes DSM 21264]|uniref:Regulator of competence-specific genes n=2 Tax=Vibrio gazogenes TaxID=687 RepID=A0A1M5APA6_VIBGA|nr:regulator of competence-specific genes [Vibrio gazogenes DSM 21264] [Vibrio gazogenes DSM 21264 = NBRC 103151]SJN58169.1 DNA transformation protein TfoX [Vibrio gazogenes]
MKMIGSGVTDGKNAFHVRQSFDVLLTYLLHSFATFSDLTLVAYSFKNTPRRKSMDKPILRDSMRLFEQLGRVKSRSMFGGFGIFVNDIMFALVVQNKLHIRADSHSLETFKAKGFEPYVYTKRGFPVVTKYFALPADYWNDADTIFNIAKQAYLNAKNEKTTHVETKPKRLKDLPNLRLATERMLRKAGINSVEELHQKGSLSAYKAILSSHPATQPPLELLWALEGAIEGKHWSVISQARRDELARQI